MAKEAKGKGGVEDISQVLIWLLVQVMMKTRERSTNSFLMGCICGICREMQGSVPRTRVLKMPLFVSYPGDSNVLYPGQHCLF